jgi:hypothetical protein
MTYAIYLYRDVPLYSVLYTLSINIHKTKVSDGGILIKLLTIWALSIILFFI